MIPMPGTSAKELSLKDYINIMDKQKWLIITPLIIIVVSVAISSFLAEPIFRATAVILIESPRKNVLSPAEAYGGYYADKEYYETQYKILRSRTFIKRIFEEKKLYLDPEFSSSKDPISAFIARIVVEPVKNSRLMNLSFEGRDPQKITELVNTIAETYVKQDLETKTKASKEATAWLMEQLDVMKKKLEASEMALVKYMEQEQVTEVPDVEKRQRSEDLLETLKREQLRLEVQVTEISRRYGPKHPEMIKVQSELESIKAKLAATTQSFLELNKKSAKYAILKREADSNRQVYETLLRRAKETGISEQLELSNIRIVDPAEVPEAPVRPNKRANIFTACIIGLVFGLGLAFAVEYLDNTIKDPDDVNIYVGLPFLGYVPSGKKEANTEEAIDLIVHQKPRSAIAEAYRTIRTSIMFAFADRPAKTILVTSSNPQEGKTTAVINFGITMASTGEKVLLVDTDMRCSRLHKSFALTKEIGLSEYLVGNIDMDAATKSTRIENVFLVTSGATPPNPAELLHSNRMKVFLEEAKKKFDRVIIDATPILTVTDASIVANIVDGVIMLVRSSKVPIEVVLRSKQKLQDAKANILGVLLNNIDVRRESYYYYYYYSDEDKTKNA